MQEKVYLKIKLKEAQTQEIIYDLKNNHKNKWWGFRWL